MGSSLSGDLWGEHVGVRVEPREHQDPLVAERAQRMRPSRSGCNGQTVRASASRGRFRHAVTSDKDRPTGFPMPSPGCYRIDVEVGELRRSITDRVFP